MNDERYKHRCKLQKYAAETTTRKRKAALVGAREI
jgi:hypothetical protein